MTDFIINIIIRVAKMWWEWSQTEEGQSVMRRFFKSIRAAWEDREED